MRFSFVVSLLRMFIAVIATPLPQSPNGNINGLAGFEQKLGRDSLRGSPR